MDGCEWAPRGPVPRSLKVEPSGQGEKVTAEFVKLDLTQPTVDSELATLLQATKVDTFVHGAFLSHPTHAAEWAHELEDVSEQIFHVLWPPPVEGDPRTLWRWRLKARHHLKEPANRAAWAPRGQSEAAAGSVRRHSQAAKPDDPRARRGVHDRTTSASTEHVRDLVLEAQVHAREVGRDHS